MNIRLLNAADQADWNMFAAAHPQGHFMQSWEWGGFKATQGWKPQVIVAEEKGKIVGGTLVQKKNLPFIGKSFLYSPRGPLLPAGDVSCLGELSAEMRRFATRNGSVFWRVDPYLGAAEAENLFPKAGFERIPMEWSYWNAPMFLMLLRLDGMVTVVFNKMASTARNEVRQAVKRGVTVDHGKLDDLADFFTLMLKTAEKKRIPHHDLEYYHSLYEILGESGLAQLFLARRDGVTGSAGISIRFGATTWLLFLASDYSIKYSNRALLWEMVKWAVESGCCRYDFRGTACNNPPRETDPGYGVYKFKKSFGAESVVMAGYYDQVYSPAVYRVFRFAEHSILPRIMAWKAKLSL